VSLVSGKAVIDGLRSMGHDVFGSDVSPTDLSGLDNLAPDGVTIPFADGHVRQLPRLTAAPFRYGVHDHLTEDVHLRRAIRLVTPSSSDILSTSFPLL